MLAFLDTWLFAPLPGPRTSRAICTWWEERRLFYNLFIGSIGFLSVVAFLFFMTHANVLKPGEDAAEPMAVFAAPIFMNICYTAGRIVETWSLRTGKWKTRLQGPALLKAGLAFSLFVVLFPSVVAGLRWIVYVSGPSRPVPDDPIGLTRRPY